MRSVILTSVLLLGVLEGRSSTTFRIPKPQDPPLPKSPAIRPSYDHILNTFLCFLQEGGQAREESVSDLMWAAIGSDQTGSRLEHRKQGLGSTKRKKIRPPMR